jgi:hypothetical protein
MIRIVAMAVRAAWYTFAMPGLALEDGEVQLLAELAESIVGGNRRAESRIVLTDRRVVLLTSADDFTRIRPFRFGRLRFVRMILGKTDPDATREVRREHFSEVVDGDGGRVAFRAVVGDGFVIRTSTPFATWQQRMRDWLADKPVTDSPSPT